MDNDSATTGVHSAATDTHATVSQTVDDETTDAATPNAKCAEPQTPADRSHPLVKTLPVETATMHARWTPSGMEPHGERRGEAAGGVKDTGEVSNDEESRARNARINKPTASTARLQSPSDKAKAMMDQGDNVRMQSVAHDHPAASQQVNDATTDVANPDAMCAGPTTSVGEPHDPPAKMASVARPQHPAEECARERASASTPDISCDTTHPPAMTSASAHSASHIPAPTTTDNATSSPPAVDGHAWADKNHLPHTPVERPWPPDETDDEVQCARVGGEAEVEEVLRESAAAKVEMAANTNGDDQHRLDLPTEPPDCAEDCARLLDPAHSIPRPPDQIQVNPGGRIETGWSERLTHEGGGDIGERRRECKDAENEGSGRKRVMPSRSRGRSLAR